MKTYIVIYNQNSRGKKYKKEELEKKFIEHDLEAKIYVTKEINEVDLVIKEFTDSNKYVYIGIGGDGTINSLITRSTSLICFVTNIFASKSCSINFFSNSSFLYFFPLEF